MSTPFLFISPKQADGKTIKINDIDDIRHIAGPLRIRPGDMAYISDDTGYRYKASLIKIDKKKAVFDIIEKKAVRRKLPSITLFQCILKKNAMENVIQKATEIGVSAIVPVISERTVPDKRLDSRKTGRWQKISDEASRQSKRDFKCRIGLPVKLNCIQADDYDCLFVPHEKAAEVSEGAPKLKNLAQSSSIAYLIGPEGGLSREEEKLLEDKGAIILKLGDNILRAETAAIYFLSVIDFYIRSNR